MTLLIVCVVLISFAGYIIGFRWLFTSSLIAFSLFCFWFLFKNSYAPTVAFFERGIDDTESAPEVFAITLLVVVFTVPNILIGRQLAGLFKTISGLIDKVLGVVFGGILGFVLIAVWGPASSIVCAILFTLTVVFVEVNNSTGGSSYRVWRARHQVKRLKRRNRPQSVRKEDEEHEPRRGKASDPRRGRKRRPRPVWRKRSRRRKDKS